MGKVIVVSQMWYRMRGLLDGYVIGVLLLIVAAVAAMTGTRPLRTLWLERDGYVVAQGTDPPWTIPMGEPTSFTGVFELGPTRPGARLSVVADDCVDEITLDGSPLEISKTVDKCDWRNGITVELPPSDSRRRLDVSGHNRNREGGLKVELRNTSRALDVMPLAFMGGTVVLLGRLLRGRSWPWSLTFVALAGLVLRFWYWSYTLWTDRAYDATGHLEYIRLLTDSWLPPPSGACWQCDQPPLSYYPGALATRIAASSKLATLHHWELQALAMMASIGFLIASLSVVRQTLTKGPQQLLTAALFTFWPAAILHSVRIGNDPFMYLFSALALRSLALWTLGARLPRNALLAATYAGLAFTTKTTGIIVLVTVLTVLGEHALRQRRHDTRMKRTLLEAAALGAGGGLLALCTPVFYYLKGLQPGVFTSNANQLSWRLGVDNRLAHFVWFDVMTWIRAPYVSPRADATGRQWFWNFLAKSGLFGEFRVDTTPLGLAVATAISIAVLAVGVFLVVGVLHAYRPEFPALLFLTLAVLTSIILRCLYPFAPSADARHVFPALLPACLLTANGLGRFSNWRYVRWLSWVVVAAVPLLSIVLFVNAGLNAP